MSRTVRPGPPWLRCTWIITVLFLLSVSVYHTTRLIQHFSNYGTTVYYKEQFLDLSEHKDNDFIPEITLCNVQPLSYRAVNNSNGIVTFADYLDHLTNKFDCPTCSRTFPRDLEADLRTAKGYFQYIGTDDARVVGHSLDDIVIECNVMIFEAAVRKIVPCQGLVNISLKQFTDNFNCYSFSVYMLPSNEIFAGFSLVLYAGSISLSEFVHFGDPVLSSRGMLLVIHPPSSIPFMNIQAVGLSTGTFNTISLSLKKHERLPDPYDGCVSPRQSNYTHPSHPGYLRYTPFTCWTGCVEEAVTINCNCRDGDLAGVTFSAYAHLPYCADAKAPADVLATRMRCAETQRDKHETTCYFRCPLSCSEASFDARPSEFKWPQDDMAATFYNQYIQDKAAESLFGTISELSNGECEILNKSCSMYGHIVKRIRDNFLGLQIYQSEHKVFVVGSQPKTDSSQLFSQIGGALNLWSGISLAAVVELAELFGNLIIAWKNKIFPNNMN